MTRDLGQPIAKMVYRISNSAVGGALSAAVVANFSEPLYSCPQLGNHVFGGVAAVVLSEECEDFV
ncbi:hypothetical protein EHH44_09095 [Mycolicibacter terrae]|uniref:Uncharacterized protein n=1 Tax=Mycolicibacter terrae TaxID=1788 RepID=A0ACD2EP93_9MYCO|nr:MULTISPECIES: hypothetical protein [Mycolicibacter]RRR45745.1 hypothetical protein EHH44_09095 [Mycolicibacter terrae]